MSIQVLSNLDLNKLPLLNVVVEEYVGDTTTLTTDLPPAANKDRIVMVHHSDNSFDHTGSGFCYCDGTKWYKVPTNTEINALITSSLNSTNPITNVTISGKTLTFTFKNGTTKAANLSYAAATQSEAGLMSAADKTKLDGIATGATKVTVDTALSSSSTNPVQNKIITTTLSGKVPTTRTVNGHALSSDVTVTKSDVGLGNVDNVKQIPASEKGAAGGVATLGTDGKVPTSQLPSYVDDVIELAGVVTGTTYSGLTVGKKYWDATNSKILLATSATAGTKTAPEADKIYSYIGTTTSPFVQNRIYRWGGSSMVEISPSTDVSGSDVTLSSADIVSSKEVPTAGTKTVKGWLGKLAGNIVYLLANFVSTSRKITAGTGLTGGGTLAADRTISHQAKPTSGSDAGGSGNYVSAVTIDSLGHVVSTTKGTLPTYTSVKVYTSGALTGTSGTIAKATHGVNTIGSVQAYMGNNQVLCDITLNSDGGVSWKTGVTMASGSNFIIKITGK